MVKFRIGLPLGVEEVRGQNWEEQIHEQVNVLIPGLGDGFICH